MTNLHSNAKTQMLNLWEDGYVCVPRKVFYWFGSRNGKDRNKGLVYVALMFLCHYADGKVMLKGK